MSAHFGASIATSRRGQYQAARIRRFLASRADWPRGQTQNQNLVSSKSFADAKVLVNSITVLLMQQRWIMFISVFSFLLAATVFAAPEASEFKTFHDQL